MSREQKRLRYVNYLWRDEDTDKLTGVLSGGVFPASSFDPDDSGSKSRK